MSKGSVERAPEFHIDKIDLSALSAFITSHKATDDKGRYLHWDQLKWRVPRADAKNIWLAVKFHRAMQEKVITITDEKNIPFSYSITHSMEAKLHQVIKIAGGSIGAIADNPVSKNIQQKFLVSSLVMEEAITSAQLEGASTTREVAKKMLEEERDPIDEDERMILNNFFLLRHAERQSKNDLTVDLILDFHKIATIKTTENNVVPGEFRQNDDIYVEDTTGEIAHQPPCYNQIPTRLQMLCDFANTDHSGSNGGQFIAPVIKAIILHFMIGYEHPFRDGNGRTARALFYWFMLKSDYELFRYVSISKLLKDDPKGYGLSYMYTEKDQNDLTYFIDFQLDIILSAFDELQRYLQQKTEEFNQVLTLLENSGYNHSLNFVQKDIIKKGTKEPGRIFTAKEIASSYDVSENTARTYLTKLVSLKLLLETKDGRTKLYLAPSDLMQRLKSDRT
ncbi:Fic family protein [Marinomonas transparens]|uniref:Fic family protein n=1 Tax=Marinomonas transparens TaxID=2795388 RepID=A0A934JW85_9GAMM|nr:Fic family protein [Marinomonas transparens]MBJ7539402.1 Fic family protein [Marinomonas transparens]